MTRDEYLDGLYTAAKEADKGNGHEPIVVELLTVYVKHRPKHDYAWLLLGDALRVLGRRHEAVVPLRMAARLAPRKHRWQAFARLGMLFGDGGKKRIAEKWFSRACAEPQGARKGWVWILRGANAVDRGDFAKAERCYRNSMDRENVPLDEAYLNLGLVLRAQRRYAEAAAALQRAIELDPSCQSAAKALTSLEGVEDAIARAAQVPDE